VIPGFERPLLAAAAPLVCFLVPVLVRLFWNRFTVNLPLGPPGGMPFKPPFRIDLLMGLIFFFELAGVFLLFIAAAGPFVVSSETVWLNRGADIIFVMDISPSMAGIDMDGKSRFDAARDMVSGFIRDRPSDAIGLVGVGDEAALLVPPTVDRRALLSRLGSLEIAELGDGTALGMGLAVAAFHLRHSEATRKAVVLITDGENNAGSVHPETATAFLRSQGISLWVIGVGSSGDIPIDYVDARTRIRRTGVFASRFDPAALRTIAWKGGGTYISAPSAEAFAEAFSRINQGEMTVHRFGVSGRPRPIHRPFIIAALALLCAARLIRRCVLGAFL
jgi:Ca-activated chloride channel family protein